MRILVLAALPLSLSACMASDIQDRPVYANVGKDNPRVRGDTGGVCNKDALMAADGFVGRTASTELGGEMMRMSGATTLQWIPEGGVVTMDYRADRLNIQLGPDGRVASLRCG